MQQKLSHGEDLRNWYSTFTKVWVLSWYPKVYFIPWEMHGNSHQYPISWEYGKSLGKPCFFKKYECFSSIRFPFYGILYHIGNPWVFPSISHTIRKRSKTHPMGEKWNTYTPWTHVLSYHGTVVWWLSLLHKFIHQSLNSSSAQVNSCSRHVGDSQWWESLTMGDPGWK